MPVASRESPVAAHYKILASPGGERQQDVAGHAAIAGYPELTKIMLRRRPGRLSSSEPPLAWIPFTVVYPSRYQNPENFASSVATRAYARRASRRRRRGDQRERSGLAGAATGSRRIAWMARREPGLPASFEMQSGRPPPFTDQTWSTTGPAVSLRRKRRNRGVHFLASLAMPTATPPLRPRPDASLPEDFSLGVRIEA